MFAQRDLGTGWRVGLVDHPALEVDDRGGGGWEGGRQAAEGDCRLGVAGEAPGWPPGRRLAAVLSGCEFAQGGRRCDHRPEAQLADEVDYLRPRLLPGLPELLAAGASTQVDADGVVVEFGGLVVEPG
ncbi:MAG TPA: hypothetical protein VLX59_06410 [Acidimicrobiales bacterium]|nr:hypothetical protein [Acidimicrobiales bacterium]